MADIAVTGVHVTSHDRVTTSQMRIVVMMPRCIRCGSGSRLLCLRSAAIDTRSRALQPSLQDVWIETRSPKTTAPPVLPIAVVTEITHFLLTGNRLIGVNVGAVPYLLLCNRDGKYLFGPVRLPDPNARNQYSSSRQPLAGLYHEITYDPCFVIKVKIFHVTYDAVRRTNGVVLHIFHAAQHTALFLTHAEHEMLGEV